MNKENAHEYLPLVQAIADGQTVQVQGGDGNWYNSKLINTPPSRYRIKPEPRTFEIVRSKLSGDIYSAETYDGSAPNTWEYITVMEVLK